MSANRVAEPRPAARLALLHRQRAPPTPASRTSRSPTRTITSAGVVEQYMQDAGRQQPRGRPPSLAAEPVRHHDGLGLDQHRERDDGDRPDARRRARTRRTSPGPPPATSRTRSSPAAAGRSRPATGASSFRHATVRVYRNGQPVAARSTASTTATPSRRWSGRCPPTRPAPAPSRRGERHPDAGHAPALHPHLPGADVHSARLTDPRSTRRPSGQPPRGNARVGCQPVTARRGGTSTSRARRTSASKSLELDERLLQPGLRQVVGDRDVRVVGEGALEGQRPLAHARPPAARTG